MNNFLYCKTAFLAGLLITMGAWAGDRPYLATSSAVAEKDDDGVWSIASTYQQAGPNRLLGGSVEYAFDPTNSIQFEFTRNHDRDAHATEHDAEVEFKHLFNHIAPDGWGWGVSASLGFSRAQDEAWRHGGITLNVPFSLSLWEGDGLFHLNAGAIKPVDEVVQWTASAALERKVTKSATVFAELARQGDQTLLNGGVRYWVKREKIAIDFSLQQTHAADQRTHGFVIGFNLFDL